MKVYCISDYESAPIFKLVNISTFEVTNRKETIGIFNMITRDADAGIILITDRIAHLIRNEIMSFVNKNDRPLILEIPSYSNLIKNEDRREKNGTISG
ncbi:MAG: V-type ATP synthase subunit F [bacterium]|nr:V-type ATP synthase subunit F [bacterium]